MNIRNERPADIDAIRRINESAFETPVESQIVDALRANGNLIISLVADAEDTVVGHVAFSPVKIDGADVGLGLGPVAVLSEYRRQGIADALIRAGLEDCRERGYKFVALLGDPAYYRRFGFEPGSRWELVDDYGGGDAFQALELIDGGIPSGGGLVRYGPEFAMADEETRRHIESRKSS